MSSTPPDHLNPEGKNASSADQNLLGLVDSDNSAASETGAKSGPRKTFVPVMSPF